MKRTKIPVLIARAIVAKDTTPARAANDHAPGVRSIPGQAAPGTGSDRRSKCPARVFTQRSNWRITTGRTAQKRSETNPIEGGTNHE